MGRLTKRNSHWRWSLKIPLNHGLFMNFMSHLWAGNHIKALDFQMNLAKLSHKFILEKHSATFKIFSEHFSTNHGECWDGQYWSLPIQPQKPKCQKSKPTIVVECTYKNARFKWIDDWIIAIYQLTTYTLFQNQTWMTKSVVPLYSTRMGNCTTSSKQLHTPGSLCIALAEQTCVASQPTKHIV